MSIPAPAQNRPAPQGQTGTGEADLWCTYAATRTLAWLGRTGEAVNADATARYLRSRRNSDGGYAWSAGMPSDAWATFYCTQALGDLGLPLSGPEATARWLDGTWTGEAYAMSPGQAPDVWATHFSTRSAVLVPGARIPEGKKLLDWLGGLQRPDGGLTWSPESKTSDVRACHYGAAAWYALDSLSPVDLPWDVPALVRWLGAQQNNEGAFRFAPGAEVPCMWATYRATAALKILGARPPRPVEPWIRERRGGSGAFVRWEGYEVEDVWASFCAVGALEAVGAPTADIGDAVVARIGRLGCEQGGYTYREPESAADVLSTAAAVLADEETSPARPGRTAWLESCQLPNEGGLMYMPARGSEIRCTLWGLTAGAFAGAGHEGARRRVAEWLRTVQNPDGGFGFWEGRGSELLSTAAAVGVVRRLGATVPQLLDASALRGFVARCVLTDGDGAAAMPGTEPTLRQGLQALRIRHGLDDADPAALTSLLGRHRVRGGGWANSGARLPDLLSTYEAVATADLYGLDVDTAHLRRFVERVQGEDGTAWSPLAPSGGGPLADALGVLLRRRTEGALRTLPDLVLS